MRRFVKRFLDIFFSLLLIILASPIILIFIILVSCTSKGGPFFVAPRAGKGGKPFKIIKFRSMRINSEGNGKWNVGDKDPRITKIGHFLRKSKIDELPQLFNVLAGQMSFVGPRPEFVHYVALYSSMEDPILDNKPGITDWASIVNSKQFEAFTNAEDPDWCYLHEIRPLKLELQLYYRNHNSIGQDFKILWWTFIKLLFRVKKYPKDIQNIIDAYDAKRAEQKETKKNIEYVQLGDSDLKVSRICFGGCPMGGYGWGETHKNDFITAIRYALDIGINFFDTADVYGIGESEKTLGEALKGRRSEAIVATKFGVRRKDGKSFYDNSPEWIKEALEESLQRLGMDYVDLYQVHYLDHKTPLEEVVKALEELVAEKKIRYYGLSNVTSEDIDALKQSHGHFIAIQDEYSLATRKNELNLTSVSEQLGLTKMTWGSLGQGILAGKIDENTKFAEGDRRLRPEYVNFHGEKFAHNLKIVELLKELSVKYNKSVSAIAIRFTLDHLKDSVTLVGIKNVDQLKENVEALGWELEKDDIRRLLEISEWKD